MDNPAELPIVGYTGAASTQVQQYWLNVAWRALQGADTTLVSRLEADLVDPASVADVVTAAARRVLRNPGGYAEESGSLDDFTESWKRADATEDVYFTTAELARLAASLVTPSAGSFKYL